MKKIFTITLLVFAFHQQMLSAQRQAPVSTLGLEANYRQSVRNASKSETVVSGGADMRRADDRSWEKRWNEMQTRKRAERKAVEAKRRELLATGKYFEDGRGNIRLKRGCRYELNIGTQQGVGIGFGAQELSGFVTNVSDGDTISVKAGGAYCRVRLKGIDAPESDQKFGDEAASYLKSLVGGKVVRIEYSETDRYGRLIGTVYLQGMDINLLMIRSGFAWHYKQYDDTQSYADAEIEARAAVRGLWVDVNPVPPWEYRRM